MASMQRLCKRGVLLDKGCIQYMGDINSTIDTYLRNNDFKPVLIKDALKNRVNHIEITDFRINDSENNIIDINEENRSLHFFIKGNCKVPQRMALEMKLFDEKHALLASYCRCHTDGDIKHFQAGEFVIDETITLPSHMTAGNFYLDVQFTDPGVAFLCTMTQPIKVRSAGYTGSHGINLPYSERGMILL